MEIECYGRKVGEDRVLIDPSIIDQSKIGEMIRLKVMFPDRAEKMTKKQLSSAAKRLLERMENTKQLGLPADPQELSHAALAEERMEEKSPWLG